jgi:hypothetical protein
MTEWPWQGKTKAIEEKPVRAILSTINTIQTDVRMNLGLVDQTPAIDSLHHGRAFLGLDSPPVGLGLLTFEVSRSLGHTTLGRTLRASDRTFAETSTWQNTQHSQETGILAPPPCGVRTHTPCYRATADSHPFVSTTPMISNNTDYICINIYWDCKH